MISNILDDEVIDNNADPRRGETASNSIFSDNFLKDEKHQELKRQRSFSPGPEKHKHNQANSDADSGSDQEFFDAIDTPIIQVVENTNENKNGAQLIDQEEKLLFQVVTKTEKDNDLSNVDDMQSLKSFSNHSISISNKLQQ